MESEVISIRVKKGTGRRLRSLGISGSSRVRAYLENLAWRAEAKKTLDELELLVKKSSTPSKKGFSVRSIREDRDEAH